MNFFKLLSFRKKKKIRSKTPALFGHPIKKGLCLRVFVMNPKKPNSAERKVAQVLVYQTSHGSLYLIKRKKVVVHIPGILHPLVKHSVIFLHGGRVRDLPGVQYRAVRGVRDLSGVFTRKQGRSKYGTKDWVKIKARSA